MDASESREGQAKLQKSAVSRRDFLKLAGVAGASTALLGGLGGLVAACGGGEGTTTTAAPAGPTTTAAAGGPETTAPAATSTTAAGVEKGRPIKLGLVYPKTGAIASFAKPDEWIVQTFKKDVKDGVVCGDGKLHMFEVLLEDSQSSAQRASQVAGDMILNSKVDMLLASSSPDNANPTADQAEANGVPMLATFVPWQPFYNRGGKPPEKPYTWTWMFHFGLEDAAQVRMALWEQLETNKKVGMLFPNDADGSAWANEKTGFTPKVQAAGYDVTQPGLHDSTAEDFTQQISQFKNNGCEICSGIETPPLFTNFWSQAIQQRFQPKICTMGKALLFHETLIALGDSGIGLSDEVVWHPTFPYKSSLSGLTGQQFADLYSEETGHGWTEPLGQYGKFEWAVDIFKRMPDPDDKSTFPKVVAETKLDTIQGLVDFTIPVDPKSAHPVPNVFKIRIAAGQWIKAGPDSKWPYDLVLCAANGPEIPTPAKMQPINYG